MPFCMTQRQAAHFITVNQRARYLEKERNQLKPGCRVTASASSKLSSSDCAVATCHASGDRDREESKKGMSAEVSQRDGWWWFGC